eukprot:CAMPEP_0201867016 /NCGR_PEP_ID=MMETSP0902-20130614/1414_1 /ASSEMBLY_ACC=CAM_ASM_000551 /TAXON_ID=420261 /ORGANISM="Thalassiosira antarctica, Strain CCMP982" /LENGTH=79 /DNA_ID=CAMNT_0048392115 /DNA_START=69 /DNA_END=305 /DNA_ORIENTATION=-
MSNPNINIRNNNKEEDDPTIDGHLKTVSNLANGITRIAVNHAEENCPKGQMMCAANIDNAFHNEDERNAENGSGNSVGG